MKKLFSAIICIVFVFNLSGIFVTAATDDTARLEKVLASVKSRIPDTSPFTEFDSEVGNEGGKIRYSFSWSDDNNRRMYVLALENGTIIEYGFREIIRGEEPPKGFDRISTDEAVNRTQKLVNKLNPQLGGKIFVEAYNGSERFESNNIYFKIVHKENGVPVKNDGGRIVVDIDAQKIISFDMTYTENLKYDSAENILDDVEAKRAFESELGLTLAYNVYKDYEKRSIKVFPTYSNCNANVYIDANTGKAVEVNSFADLYGFASDKAALEKESVNTNGGIYSEAELKEFDNLNNLMSAADAERLLRTNGLLKIPADFVAERTVLQKDIYYKDKYTYGVLFTRNKNKTFECIDATVDAKTGDILRFSDFTDRKKPKNKYSNSKLKEEADRVFKELAPEKFDEYVFDGNMDTNGYFCYERYVNEVPVFGDTVRIELSQSDSQLMSYMIEYTDVDFPKLDDAVSHSEACKAFFDNTEYNPMYIPYRTDETLKNNDATALVYDIKDSGILIDAFSGKRVTYSGAEYDLSDDFKEYSDIDGHYAEEKIRALRRFGIGFSGELFKPDKSISQTEFLKLCEQAFGGVLSVLDLSGPAANILTRIEATRLICKALKIDKIAEIEKIYNCPFSDVVSGKGYVSLLWGLNIVNGTSENKFSPDDGLTRAQAAVLIYNTMDVGL